MLVIQSIVDSIIQLMIFVVFLSVIMSWLIAFGVVNRHNQFVDMVWRTTNGLTEPLLRPIRQIIPNFGGIDISPIFLLIGLNALRIGLDHYVFRPLVSSGL